MVLRVMRLYYIFHLIKLTAYIYEMMMIIIIININELEYINIYLQGSVVLKVVLKVILKSL